MIPQWYYGEHGSHSGPFTIQQVQEMIAHGRIGAATLMWREGMPQWQSLAELQRTGGLDIAPAIYPAYASQRMSPSGLSITSLVCGITGMAFCVPLSVVAVVCGHMALSKITSGEHSPSGRGMAIAGLICGYLIITLTVFFVAFMWISIASGHR